MQIGWVDFSKTERDKVVSILRLLGTQTALDELGIGTVRDAFSDMFFPGISTLQTRAKYFVILPYLFAQAENHRFKHRRDVLAYIHNEEFTLVKTLVKNSGPEAYGIVGSRNMEKMVKMKPSSIYWNGLRTVGILRYLNISLDEACEIVLRNERIKREVTLKTESADEAADDTDALAGKTVLFSPIVPDYDVQKDATIELTKKEAQYLYDHFLDSPATCNSLTAYMLREKIRFPSFWEIPYATVPSDISDAVHLAQEFAEFIYGAHLLYNIIYADGCGLLILRASRLKRGNPSLAIGRNPGCAHTLQWATLTLRSMRRPCRELRTSEAPSTPPSVHLCWQQHLSGKKDWTSITTAEKSCTGICHQTQLIWSNGKAGSTVISAMRSVRTWQTANSELSHLKRAFGRRPWIVRQWP